MGDIMRSEHGLVVLGVVLASLASPFTASAEVKMPPVFSSEMVLQRELPVPVWGSASPGEDISVSFAGQELDATADDQGQWMVQLQPLETSNTNRTMIVRGSNTIIFDRVLVGEVWLCSGQSNMAGKFVESKGRRIDPRVFDTDLSGFRFSNQTGWHTLSQRSQNLISCVAYYFGIELYRELDIPIGLILRYNSGTPIQAWMPKEASEVIRKRLKIPEDWKDAQTNRNPAVQFDDKIAPIVPVAFGGVIWYQGERNAKAETGYEYDDLLTFHIKTWRELWAERAGLEVREFPFYFVQVPTQESPVTGEWPWLRDRMRRALDKTENTGMAIFYDYGPGLHPENKEPAGQRLSLWALAKDYGRKDLVHCGPLLDQVQFDGDKAVLSFRHVGGGLKSKTGESNLKFFEIAGKDGNYVEAKSRIEEDTVVVQSKEVAAPAYVRYLFRKPEPNSEVSLINAEGLPASSFITDDFKPERTGGQTPIEIRKGQRKRPKRRE